MVLGKVLTQYRAAQLKSSLRPGCTAGREHRTCRRAGNGNGDWSCRNKDDLVPLLLSSVL